MWVLPRTRVCTSLCARARAGLQMWDGLGTPLFTVTGCGATIVDNTTTFPSYNRRKSGKDLRQGGKDGSDVELSRPLILRSPATVCVCVSV